MKPFIFLVLILLSLSKTFGQTAQNRGHDTVKYLHKRHKRHYTSRMEMQLRQARYHEQQVKRAEEVQKRAAKDEH